MLIRWTTGLLELSVVESVSHYSWLFYMKPWPGLHGPQPHVITALHKSGNSTTLSFQTIM